MGPAEPYDWVDDDSIDLSETQRRLSELPPVEVEVRFARAAIEAEARGGAETDQASHGWTGYFDATRVRYTEDSNMAVRSATG